MTDDTKLRLHPITYEDASRFVDAHHRHHRRPRGHKFSISAVAGGVIVGVVMVGRPVSRFRDDGTTMEITRLCTRGHRNACSFLYGAAVRASFAMGYRRVGTYTLQSEGGASLKAAGWYIVAETKGGSWSRESRLREDNHPTEPKFLWETAA